LKIVARPIRIGAVSGQAFMWKMGVFCLVFLWGCSGFEKSEQTSLRKAKATSEKILRHHKEELCVVPPLKRRVRAPYSFEVYDNSNYPKITKEYFRCRGNAKNSPRFLHEGVLNVCRYDCGGYDKHSLPLRGGKEFVYPILIELLNEVQEVAHKRVKITCGHRCPTHHVYATPKQEIGGSKHWIGAEVDFYVEGLQEHPEEVVDILMGYYEKRYPDQTAYTTFTRASTQDTQTKAWYNQEVLFKIYQKGEGRDFDNEHPYPYITIQVRYDKDLQQKVISNLDDANKCFLRW